MEIKQLSPSDINEEEYLLFYESICNNLYIPHKPYPKQSWAIYEANRLNKRTTADGKRLHNHVLAGAGGFGGKTYLGSMLASQYLTEENYSCLVTRKNYTELIGIDSIFQNLVKWTCDEKLGNNACNKVEGKLIRIKSPFGAEIHFKAFDREDKKQKIKSESYDRIINDEASELDPRILSFQHRSLRQSITSKIPLSIINLSNPGGPSTKYLIENYINPESPYPYIGLDWRDNPYINKNDYEVSLDELDYIDKQYQKYGNWYYKPNKGDLITRNEILESLISKPAYKVLYTIISIDLAGRGRDKTAISNYQLLEDNIEYLKDLDQTSSPYPEEMIYKFIRKHNPIDENLRTNIILIEQEPGGDSEYSFRYWKNELKDFLSDGIGMKLVPQKLSKYQRARPWVRQIRQGRVKLDKNMHLLDELIDETISIDPEGKGKSPNLLDSVTLAKNFLDKKIKTSQTRFSIKKVRY